MSGSSATCLGGVWGQTPTSAARYPTCERSVTYNVELALSIVLPVLFILAMSLLVYRFLARRNQVSVQESFMTVSRIDYAGLLGKAAL